jgi:hypothetical protein
VHRTRPKAPPRRAPAIKEQLGKATDDKSLEAEGQSDQAKGNLKDAGEKVKDAFKSNARIQVASPTRTGSVLPATHTRSLPGQVLPLVRWHVPSPAPTGG